MSSPELRFVTSPSARARLDAVKQRLAGLAPGAPVLLVGASRSAADELAFTVAEARGGLFGLTRLGFHELATRLALPRLARLGLSPTGGLGAEAIAARAAFDAADAGRLSYLAPIGHLPGFPRSLSRTLAELRLARVTPAEVRKVDQVGSDLADLLARADDEARKAGTVDRARLLDVAVETLEQDPSIVAGSALVLLDVPVITAADRRLVTALTRAATSTLITVPEGDRQTLHALDEIGFSPIPPPAAVDREADALARLQRHLFSREAAPVGSLDSSVVIFSAPGEGRESIEIARRVLDEASRGVPFDAMAVLLRAPHIYLGLLEHAFQRAGVPAWFERGARRPDPAGRAFLALLACADERLSARRFAEYLSLGQVPSARPRDETEWSPPADEVTEAIVPQALARDEAGPEDEAQAASSDAEIDGVAAGTLRAPWRWEELLVESAVIDRLDRWEGRLSGLRAELTRRLHEIESDEPESPRVRAIRRDIRQLDQLRRFALPIVRSLAEWPRSAAWTWARWLSALDDLAPRVLKHPSRVARVLHELGPLGDIGPVSLREVREVLAPRLLTLTHEPPRRRCGRVFVGTPAGARGRSFSVVFVPGLAERLFPQRLREDALLLDESRASLSASLATQKQRGDDERLQLRLAVGAASARVYVSWPRVEIQETRPRVPSFYVLDVARAVEGRIPEYGTLRDRAFAAGGATLAWPAPADPVRALDVFEHDLAMLAQLLRDPDPLRARGRGRYLYDLSPHLRRSLTARWARWQRRWHTADGLIRATLATAPALARQRLGARPYSLSALQRFADCPYQFQLSAIFQLAPLEVPAPLQRLDPLTRGSLFHQIQAELFRGLESNGMLPVTERRLDAARKMLDWAIATVEKQAYDDLAPAIDRVWRDELAGIGRDLRGWLEGLARDGERWRPERFELAFGLPGDHDRDPRSFPEPAHVDRRFLIRGSIDLVERRVADRALRVTDHKTGRNRTSRATMIDGGRVLQPVLYGMSLEALTGDAVEEGRLSYCTSVGGFSVHSIALDDLSRRRALEALEVIDRAVEQGTLAARPADGACGRCDFRAVCGGDAERRTRRKPAALFADLDALRHTP